MLTVEIWVSNLGSVCVWCLEFQFRAQRFRLEVQRFDLRSALLWLHDLNMGTNVQQIIPASLWLAIQTEPLKFCWQHHINIIYCHVIAMLISYCASKRNPKWSIACWWLGINKKVTDKNKFFELRVPVCKTWSELLFLSS